MVADDIINYLRKFIMLNNKEDWILIHNLHVLKSYSTKKLINEIPEKGWRLRSLNYLAAARNRHNRSTAGQWQTSHITYCWEHWCSQWFGAQSGGCTRDTQNYPSHRQGNWHFAEVGGTHHTQRHSAKVPEETILAWSGIQHSITDQATNQWRNRLNARVKPKLLLWCVCP